MTRVVIFNYDLKIMSVNNGQFGGNNQGATLTDIVHLETRREPVSRHPARENDTIPPDRAVYLAVNDLYTALNCGGSPLDHYMVDVFGGLLSGRDLEFDFEGRTYNLLQENGYIGQQADIMTILMSGFLGRVQI